MFWGFSMEVGVSPLNSDVCAQPLQLRSNTELQAAEALANFACVLVEIRAFI